jgi:PAS domain S-box-containing protein
MPNRDSRRDRLGRFFTSEVFIFEEPGRIRRTLKFILATLLAGAAAIAAYAYAIGWMTTFWTAFGATLAFFLVTVLLRWDYPRLAGIVMLLALLAAVTQGIAAADGVHDVAIVVYPAVIIIGSLLLNTRFYVVLSLLVIACAAGIGVLELRGTLTNKFSGTFEYPDVVIMVVILAAEAVVIRLLAGVLSSSLKRAYSSERSYRGIFNATSEAIFVHDADGGVILDANESALHMFGYGREEMLATTPTLLTPDALKAEGPQNGQMFEETLRTGTSVFERLLKRKDGSRFWAEVTLRVAEIGGQNRILAVVRDVDARKKMEERLHQSEKLEAVGQLAGGIAHDFNNQLAGIVGYADLIRSEIEDGTELADSVDKILVAARRAADLTGQLLAFARRGKYESAAVDIHGLVDEVLSLARHSMDQRIAIERELDAEPSHTLGDQTQLQSAILNLAINARDAMPEGGTLKIVTRAVDLQEADEPCVRDELPPGRYVRIEVVDTGVGMDEDTQKRIFEPFFTTKPMGKGTGMGLAAVYGTIKNHGGAIGVESAPGGGSTFRILLPAYEGPILPSERPDAHKATTRARVLIVDDDEEVCRLAARMLEGMGHTALVRRGGLSALEFYRESWREIDVVVLDMSMPQMGGRETFAALKQINPDAIVLLTSGFSLDRDVHDLLESGAAGLVQKPFSKKEFAAVVAEAVQLAANRPVTEPGDA